MIHQRHDQLPHYCCLVLWQCFVGHFSFIWWVKALFSCQTMNTIRLTHPLPALQCQCFHVFTPSRVCYSSDATSRGASEDGWAQKAHIISDLLHINKTRCAHLDIFGSQLFVDGWLICGRLASSLLFCFLTKWQIANGSFHSSSPRFHNFFQFMTWIYLKTIMFNFK